jgi:F0F1-type ATP synthase membrane subunit b/b'
MMRGEVALFIAVPLVALGILAALVYRWKKKTEKALDTKNCKIEKDILNREPLQKKGLGLF